MQALYDGDVVSKVKFSVLSAAVIGAMALHTFESQNRLDLCDWIMLAKRYSKEIEYSDQNVETLFSACWREEALQTESLIGLFVS